MESIHDIEIPPSAITDIVQRFSFDDLFMFLVKLSITVLECPSFKDAGIGQAIASVVSSVVAVDIGIPSSSIDAVVGFLGSEWD